MHVQADSSWAGTGAGTWAGTDACFIFKLGDGRLSERFDPSGADEHYQYTEPTSWQVWGSGSDLHMGYDGALGAYGGAVHGGVCNQGTYSATTDQVCGGSATTWTEGTIDWGATELVVFGRLPVRTKLPCLCDASTALGRASPSP